MSLSTDVFTKVRQSSAPITAKQLVVEFFPEYTPSRVSMTLRDLWNAKKLQRVEAERGPTNQRRFAYYYDGALIEQPAEKKSASNDVTGKSKKPNDKSLDDILSSFADQLATTLVDRVVDKLKASIETKLREAVPQALPTLPKRDEALKPAPLMKVCITHLLPQQAGMLAQEFGQAFDLRFWNDKTGDGVSTLKSLGVTCDYVLHHTDHASHATDGILKSIGARVIRVSGGMTRLRDELTRLYVEGKEAR